MRESNLGESRRGRRHACTRAECECRFSVGTKVPLCTYKALILGRLFIRLLFNFPFLTCPFPPRRRGNPLFSPSPSPRTSDGGLSRRTRERLKNKRPGKTRRKNPSRTMSSRGRPAESFSLSFSSSRQRETPDLSTVFPVTRERNSEHRRALHAIPHVWHFNALV